jgi:hypothetical protein
MILVWTRAFGSRTCENAKTTRVFEAKKSSGTFDSIPRFLLVQTDYCFRQLAFLKSFIQLILGGFYYSWPFGLGDES